LSDKLKFTGKNPLATLGDGLDGLSRYAVADYRGKTIQVQAFLRDYSQ
jgi:hypothetical protein